MADWLACVDLLDHEAMVAAATPVMAAMTNPNGLDRAQHCYELWRDAWHAAHPWIAKAHPVAAGNYMRTTSNALDAVGLDQMTGKDWRESATGVRA